MHREILSNVVRSITTDMSARVSPLRRSYLYVPCSSERKLQKSLQTHSDILIYDLEDSISPSPEDKAAARMRLKGFLSVRPLDLSGAFYVSPSGKCKKAGVSARRSQSERPHHTFL